MKPFVLALPLFLSAAPTAHAEIANVEADNGMVYHVLEAVARGGRAEAVIMMDGDYRRILIFFDCVTHQQQIGHHPWTYVPPRSIGARIERIACNSPNAM